MKPTGIHHRAACLVAAAALVSLFAATAGYAQTENQVTGTLRTIDGTRVLTLWGSSEERGYAHGYLVGKDIVDTFEDIILDPRVVKSHKEYETRVRDAAMRSLHFSTPLMKELEAMFRGIVDAVGVDGLQLKQLNRQLDIKDLMALNSLADWHQYACSSFSVWGKLTKDGDTLTGRNLDFMPLKHLTDQHLIIVHLDPPRAKHSWVSVAWPGLIGAYTAMNDDGVTISMHDAPMPQVMRDLNPLPRSFALRFALEAADAETAVENVKGMLVRAPSMVGNNIHVSVPYTGQPYPAVVFEYDGDANRQKGATLRKPDMTASPPWLTCTNHYCVRSDPPEATTHSFDTVRRFNRIDSAIGKAAKSGTRIDVEWAHDLLAKVATSGDIQTLHSVVYLPNRKEMVVYLARSEEPATSADPVRLRLEDLLKK